MNRISLSYVHIPNAMSLYTWKSEPCEVEFFSTISFKTLYYSIATWIKAISACGSLTVGCNSIACGFRVWDIHSWKYCTVSPATAFLPVHQRQKIHYCHNVDRPSMVFAPGALRLFCHNLSVDRPCRVEVQLICCKKAARGPSFLERACACLVPLTLQIGIWFLLTLHCTILG